MKSISQYMKMIDDAENGIYEQDVYDPEIDNEKARDQGGLMFERVEENAFKQNGYIGHITQVVDKVDDNLYYVVEVEDEKGKWITTLRIYHYLPKAEPYETLQANAKSKFQSWISNQQAKEEVKEQDNQTNYMMGLLLSNIQDSYE
ncbi:hypothetical protein PBI_SCTP2_310 [Salicola phage SCTP-2]|nr:hypothetical protein PBI_SCTP2_310 [Salicola phage SCTP-2]